MLANTTKNTTQKHTDTHLHLNTKYINKTVFTLFLIIQIDTQELNCVGIFLRLLNFISYVRSTFFEKMLDSVYFDIEPAYLCMYACVSN